jgi:predicted Zn-dependent protease
MNLPVKYITGKGFFFIPGILLYLFILNGCAVNPATGQREFMMVSEGQEFEIGRNLDKQIREEMGVYLELPQLRSLVRETGEALGRKSDRPGLVYRVEVIDSPDFNAFAVPGGFVYVNRGLLEKMNSLDELAFVMGHEIAHVAARHSASQMSKAQLVNLGLIGLAVGTGGAAQDYGQLINMSAALAFNKFSRDDEREADHFGLNYMIRAGYNPKAALSSIKQMQRLERKAPTTMESWFQTHPLTSERLSNVRKELKSIPAGQRPALERPVKRNEFITLLDGLAVGEWNGNELVRGNRYYNKSFLISMEIPQNWHVQIHSKPSTALFIQQKRGFYGFFDIQALRSRKTSAQYFREFELKINQLGARKIEGLSNKRTLKHGALSGVYGAYDKSSGPVLIEGIAFARGAYGYSLLGISKQEDFKVLQPDLESMMNGLRFISQEKASQLEPPRLRIHRVVRGETWSGITRKYFGTSREWKKLAAYNGFETEGGLSHGTLLKIPPSLRFK